MLKSEEGDIRADAPLFNRAFPGPLGCDGGRRGRDGEAEESCSKLGLVIKGLGWAVPRRERGAVYRKRKRERESSDWDVPGANR